MASCREGYTRSMAISVVDCADMQQAWRDAFAEVEYRHRQARLAAPDSSVHNTGRKHEDSHEDHDDHEAITPRQGWKQSKGKA